MSEKQQISPAAIEAAHFEMGQGEVEPPRPYAEESGCPSGEIYTFSVPPQPIPMWVRDAVARRRESVKVVKQNSSGR